MCKEVYLSDVRFALADQCDEDEEMLVDELLAPFDDPYAESTLHAIEHARRAQHLQSTGDDAADIHLLLARNLMRGGDHSHN